MKKLTLSFDNGPCAEVTPQVLDLLAERGLPASFFVCGKNLLDPALWALTQRAWQDGHRIGNHTFSHTIQFGRDDDPQAPMREIGRTQELLGELAGQERLFRPYGGGGTIGPQLFNRAALDYLCAGRYTCVLWNSVPRDWDDITGWPERALQVIASQDWTLVVLHDLPTGAMSQLPRFLDQVEREGIDIVAEFPDDCVPIRRGEPVGPMDQLVTLRPVQT